MLLKLWISSIKQLLLRSKSDFATLASDFFSIIVAILLGFLFFPNSYNQYVEKLEKVYYAM